MNKLSFIQALFLVAMFIFSINTGYKGQNDPFLEGDKFSWTILLENYHDGYALTLKK